MLLRSAVSPGDLPLRSIPPTALRLWTPPSNVPEGGTGLRGRQPTAMAKLLLECGDQGIHCLVGGGPAGAEADGSVSCIDLLPILEAEILTE